MTVTIKKVEKLSEIVCKYESQLDMQSVYVELNDNVLSASYNSEIGYAVPVSVWNGTVQRWAIPLLTVDATNNLLEEIAELCSLDELPDAESIEAIVSPYRELEGAQIDACSAGDWLENSTHYNDDCVVIDDVITITSDTTDDELSAAVIEIENDCDLGVYMYDIRKFLEKCRDEL